MLRKSQRPCLHTQIHLIAISGLGDQVIHKWLPIEHRKLFMATYCSESYDIIMFGVVPRAVTQE